MTITVPEFWLGVASTIIGLTLAFVAAGIVGELKRKRECAERSEPD